MYVLLCQENACLVLKSHLRVVRPSVSVQVPFLGERLPAAPHVAGVRTDQVSVTAPSVRPLMDLHLVLPVEDHAAHSAPFGRARTRGVCGIIYTRTRRGTGTKKTRKKNKRKHSLRARP